MKTPTVIKDYQLFRYAGCTEMIIIMEQLVDYLVDYELPLPDEIKSIKMDATDFETKENKQ